MLLIGGRRNTIDVDFTLTSAESPGARRAVMETAVELDLDVEESIPSAFMPLPSGYETRHILIGSFGMVTAYIFDPYSIAVMKIDRAFESDIEDVRFLLQHGHIDMGFLKTCVEEVISRYDEPLRFKRNFEELLRGL